MADVLSKRAISLDPSFMLVEAVVRGQMVLSFSHFVENFVSFVGCGFWHSLVFIHELYTILFL